jgi:hypothetical protein
VRPPQLLYGYSVASAENRNQDVCPLLVLWSFVTQSDFILLGAFATEVAASTWEEIQKENDLDMLEKGEVTIVPGEGTIQDNLASSQFFRMLGVDAEDLGVEMSCL